jgi:hypothetical protein
MSFPGNVHVGAARTSTYGAGPRLWPNCDLSVPPPQMKACVCTRRSAHVSACARRGVSMPSGGRDCARVEIMARSAPVPAPAPLTRTGSGCASGRLELMARPSKLRGASRLDVGQRRERRARGARAASVSASKSARRGCCGIAMVSARGRRSAHGSPVRSSACGRHAAPRGRLPCTNPRAAILRPQT